VTDADAELVTRARQGDPAAFGELVDRHQSAVYRAARAALGSHAEAEDAAQDAFILAFRRLDSFRGEASFKTWLLTIAWRQAINRRRSMTRMWRRLVTPQGDEPDAAVAAIDGAPPTPEAAAAVVELKQAIRDALRRLPPKLRDTFLLAQSGDYGYEEIAEMLSVPVGTIKWRVSEARRRVRQALGDRGFVSAARREPRVGDVNA
jgi:RNA polymerase sigma-70 factor (ECF subfamily)